VIDTGGQILAEYPNYYEYSGSGYKNMVYSFELEDAVHYRYEDKLYSKDKGDTLYVFSDEGKQPKYIFKNERSIEPFKNSLTQEQFHQALAFRYIYETDSRIYFSYFTALENDIIRTDYAYYDKLGKQVYTTRKEIKNDIDGADPVNYQDNYIKSDLPLKDGLLVSYRRGFATDTPPIQLPEEEAIVVVLLYLK
ncbi:MAG: hypothetical protein LBM61_00915, partial [Prevotellaceae bacterium]|nr:hypothetical protein [Prevotellaceae bacterium]